MSEITAGPGVIRIALVEMTGLMKAVVKDAIEDDGGLAVVADISSVSALPAGRSRDYDVVVTSVRRGYAHLDPLFQNLLFHFPHTPVIAFSGDGGHMEVFDRNVVRRVAPNQIPQAIRNTKARSS